MTTRPCTLCDDVCEHTCPFCDGTKELDSKECFCAAWDSEDCHCGADWSEDKSTKLDVESMFILDAQTAMNMLDSPPEPNEKLIELLRMK